MTRTAINVYSVRALDEPIDQIVDRIGKAGYDGIQFSGQLGPRGGDPKAIAEQLDHWDLAVTPPHVGIDALRHELEDIVNAYESFDVDAVVISGIDAEHFESESAVDSIASELNELTDELAEIGLDLHYHNHAHEYVTLDDEWAFERFIDATEIGIELDVGWALVGGDDPEQRIRNLGSRAELIHMKDMDTSVKHGFVEIGDGDVDMTACATAARDVGSEWLIYEHDDPDNPVDSINHGAKFLSTV